MLDVKKVGIKIMSLRKNCGYSQEKLAEILNISPSAISKWENGHGLPDASLFPILAQIFECTIDNIIMPAYLFDEKVEEAKLNALDQQAEHIAKYLFNKMGNKLIQKENIGLVDDFIADIVIKRNPMNWHGESIEVHREKSVDSGGKICTNITVSSPQEKVNLTETVYQNKEGEFNNYMLLNDFHMPGIKPIYYVDNDKNIILQENIDDSYIIGYNYDEDNENGVIIRKNHNAYLCAAADYHRTFWENRSAFERLGGLPWHLESKENMLAFIYNLMEKPFEKYRKDEDNGKISKKDNNITKEQVSYYEEALKYLKKEYIQVVESRFHAGKNITLIHGDLHPGKLLMSKSTDRKIKFVDEGVRMGLCTDDLAMLIALHISTDKNDLVWYALDNKAFKENLKAIKKSNVMSLLDYYYNYLSETIKDYSYETFINDYKLSVASNLFFPVRLINDGICDFCMRDKAIRAFELFVLGVE